MPNAPTQRSTLLLLLLLAPIGLAGCQTLQSLNPFAHKQSTYRSAQQEKPLDVPPDLDQPATRQALVIPQGGPRSRRGLTVDPQALQGLPVAKPTDGAVTTRTLTVSGKPDSVYRRAGIALAHVGQVTSHDDATHTYKVAIKPDEPEAAQGDFFSKVYHRGKGAQPNATVTLQVTKHGHRHSMLSAHGGFDAVARVMAVLQKTLK